MKQRILTAERDYGMLVQYLRESGEKRVFLVCGRSIDAMPIQACFASLPRWAGIEVVQFSGFQPNPDYQSVVEGVRAFRESRSGMIVAVGGGSAMDVAKCIKLWCRLDPGRSYLEQEPAPNDVKLLAVPTTAGSGSEATQFAVIYSQGRKQSIASEACLPSAVLFDPSVLDTLPAYPKRAAMLDALCHGVESFWSVHATPESKEYARRAIQSLLAHYRGYLEGERQSGAEMLQAAHLAGRAIHITQTTAGHAMCYGLTSRYGLAHGHGAALCVAALWPYMLEHLEDCVDPRGSAYLEGVFQELAAAMGCAEAHQAARRFRDLLDELELRPPQAGEEDPAVLAKQAAPERLRNHPVRLERTVIQGLYHEILCIRPQEERC